MTAFDAAEDLKILLGANIIGGCDVTDDGGGTGRLISYATGYVYDAANDNNQIIVAATAVDLLTDDTHFVYWTAGTGLLNKTTAVSGNDVLIATVTTTGGNISDITPAGFNHNNVAGISTRPFIMLNSHKLDLRFSKDSGVIYVKDEVLNNFDLSFQMIWEFYTVMVGVTYDGSLGSKTIKNIIREIRSKIVTNNRLLGHEYFYNPKYNWEGISQLGSIDMIIDAKARRAS